MPKIRPLLVGFAIAGASAILRAQTPSPTPTPTATVTATPPSATATPTPTPADLHDAVGAELDHRRRQGRQRLADRPPGGRLHLVHHGRQRPDRQAEGPRHDPVAHPVGRRPRRQSGRLPARRRPGLVHRERAEPDRRRQVDHRAPRHVDGRAARVGPAVVAPGRVLPGARWDALGSSDGRGPRVAQPADAEGHRLPRGAGGGLRFGAHVRARRRALDDGLRQQPHRPSRPDEQHAEGLDDPEPGTLPPESVGLEVRFGGEPLDHRIHRDPRRPLHPVDGRAADLPRLLEPRAPGHLRREHLRLAADGRQRSHLDPGPARRGPSDQ